MIQKTVLPFAAIVFAAPVLAAEPVGRTSAINPSAYQAAPGSGRAELKLQDTIYRDAELTTGADGALEIRFADNSKLALASKSTAVVDTFLYGGPAQAGEQSVRILKGLSRFVSGTIPKEKVRIETPAVVIGIRGTMVRTLVDDDGTTTVGVDDGLATVTPIMTGQTITVRPGEKITIGPDGRIGQMQNGAVDACD
jgi:hypothetical protein